MIFSELLIVAQTHRDFAYDGITCMTKFHTSTKSLFDKFRDAVERRELASSQNIAEHSR